MELLDLVGQDDIQDEADEMTPSAYSYAGHTMFLKELFGQTWVHLRQDVIRGNYFKSGINKLSVIKWQAV
jgi:hypothetical protein